MPKIKLLGTVFARYSPWFNLPPGWDNGKNKTGRPFELLVRFMGDGLPAILRTAPAPSYIYQTDSLLPDFVRLLLLTGFLT